MATDARQRLEGELGSRRTSRTGKRDDYGVPRGASALWANDIHHSSPRGVRDKLPRWFFPFSAVVPESRRCPSIGHHLSILTAQSLKPIFPTTRGSTNGVVLDLTCYLDWTEVPTRLAYTIRKASNESGPAHPTALCHAGNRPVTG
ncbi:hypothetical protein CSAL01_10178 [Colletotrichum salicis]|uniref:Uncharacterized protein n=1 Tax=Colletotrichum salicis TaxID=1209931 RepID=A0A135TLM9_9PEZI|nr:hypothetical protein CSAL01_10178 [Colletotrichum salicis]